MKRTIEKAAILSLSLLLVSTYSVSSALPAMLEHFSDRPQVQIEQLISITSLAIMVVIILNNWISRWISQRVSIVTGLILLCVCGSAPLYVQSYELVLTARILLGIGIGLVNAHAINMINERYDGQERTVLLGYRGSAEVLGNAVLTLIAGRFLVYGWNRAFAIYLAGLPILILYLLFVPKKETENKAKAAAVKDTAGKATGANGHVGFLIKTVAFGVLLICINSCMSMRIPGLVLGRNMGSDSDSSIVLSMMLLMGIMAGIVFGKLVEVLKGWFTAMHLFLFSAGLLLIAFSQHIVVLAIGAMAAGFACNILTTILFQRVSVKLPAELMALGTTCALVGCNMGSTVSAVMLRVIGIFSDGISIPFLVYAAATGVLGMITALFAKMQSDR